MIQSSRNSNGASTSKKKFSFSKTKKETTNAVDNYVAQVKLVPPPKKPEELYQQSVQGFEKLGESEPWSSVGSHGAASSDSDCHVARDYMIPYRMYRFPLLIREGNFFYLFLPV